MYEQYIICECIVLDKNAANKSVIKNYKIIFKILNIKSVA